jgi:hypothetical protein
MISPPYHLPIDRRTEALPCLPVGYLVDERSALIIPQFPVQVKDATQTRQGQPSNDEG